MMPPKMLTSTALTFGIGEDDAERFGDLLVVGAAADVEEVRRLAAVELDDVHRAHGEAGAVDEAADVAVELARSSGPRCSRGLRRDLPRRGRAARRGPCGETWRCRRR